MTKELIEDMVQDLIGEFADRFAETVQGPQRAYFEIRDMNGSTKRFVYQTFAAVLAVPATPEAVEAARKTVYDGVLGLKGEEAMSLVYRLAEKVAGLPYVCEHCGWHYTIRTRVAAVPAKLLETGDIVL